MGAKSTIRRGLQRRGNTQIDSSILVEQTGDMEIMVRSGFFQDVGGNKFTLESDEVISLTSDGTYDKEVYIALTNPSNPGIEILTHLVGSRNDYPDLSPDEEWLTNFEPIQVLVGWKWLVIPAGATILPDFYTYSFIGNVGVRRKPDGTPTFYGHGQESGEEFEFDEIPHFAQSRGAAAGMFYHPSDGSVTKGAKGDPDAVRIKDVK